MPNNKQHESLNVEEVSIDHFKYNVEFHYDNECESFNGYEIIKIIDEFNDDVPLNDIEFEYEICRELEKLRLGNAELSTFAYCSLLNAIEYFDLN